MKELSSIQKRLNAPKDKYNKFGGYSYRSCEGILEALKPLLEETDCTLTISDDMVLVGNRIYVKATATLTNKDGQSVCTTAFAREEETKKGMDSSQITGAASSYARKYALNGLFCIDDNKDSDETNTHDKETARVSVITPALAKQAFADLEAARTKEEYSKVWAKYAVYPDFVKANGEFYNACAAKSKSLAS